MKELIVAITMLACGATCAATALDALDELMPIPAKIERRDGCVDVSQLRNVQVIVGNVPGAPDATADEAYVLDIGEEGAAITAIGLRGERWARVTIDQIVRLSDGGRVPCCRITDWPRLKWRGFMLDAARNYLPPSGIKNVIDMMSRYKLNLFHWHLTENYAWRLESKKYPELQSKRAFFNRHIGKFYTQEEFREVVDYAYERGICVMPEFDLPAHSAAFRSAFGFKTMSDHGVGKTAAALFDELCSLASKEKMPFVHMGTDEVWKRDVEATSREALEMMSAAIAAHGRTVVRWTPGEEFGCKGPFVSMMWTDEVSPEKNPGPYFDAIGMYIEDFDPFELLSVATCHKAARWHDAGDRNLGAIFCAWHDGFAGFPYENLLRNQQVFPSCVLFGNAYWRGREEDLPKFRKCLPFGGDRCLAEAADIERRTIAQRDKALRDIAHPFHFLRQTDMRWRLTQADGTLIATDIAQATISPGRLADLPGGALSLSNGTVVAETWIKSPKAQTVGAWIGFTNLSRDHGLANSAPLPNVGEWNRFGASVELNGERIAPPKWKRPGLKKGGPAPVWSSTGTIYEADEVPFEDQEYYMRKPTQIRLRDGWNHVKLTIPNPMVHGARKHRWSATFIPVAGTTDHPHEVPGLKYSSVTPCREVISTVKDGLKFNQTAAFQMEIDDLYAAGGGTLRIPAGEYIVSSLRLKSGVTLHLDRFAYLYGATNECEYVRYENKGDTAYSVIYAEGATNVAVVGEGVIDGRGRLHNRSRDHKLYPGWDDLYFQDCMNVRVEGVTLRNASSWCCFFRGCDGVVARRVKILNHCNWSNDGIDIESSNVLVEDCDIDSEDDSLVMKAREPWRVVENVVVRNCRLSCNAEHIKIGTESQGTFRNILVEDCDVACRTPKCATGGYLKVPGVVSLQTALSAISLFVVDGGSLEDVTVRRVKVGEGIITPICIRHAARKARQSLGEGFFRNVLIENVKMSAPSASFVACSITGLPDKRPQNITLRNVELMFKGGGCTADAEQKIIEEHPGKYPAPYYVFRSTFPAYAFYLRHADNIRFENVKFIVEDPDEARPPIVADDATYEIEP